MITGFHKAKCPSCGHEFVAMEGGFVPNTPVCCPKCGTVINLGSSTLIEKLLEIIFRK